MFGKNPVEKADIEGDGRTLHVVQGSPFYTIQGEGPYAGEPAVFLRLHGCPLRCFFCDTEFSHPGDPIKDINDIATDIYMAANPRCNLLVITGGEPVRQNLGPLVAMFLERGWRVQVETAGILWQECLRDVTVVVSPKTGKIDRRVNDIAAAFKYVIQAGQVSDMDGLPVTNTQVEGGRPLPLARPIRPNAEEGFTLPDLEDWSDPEIFLSPMDEYDEAKNQANRDEVARVAMYFGYRAGLQLHKFFNLP